MAWGLQFRRTTHSVSRHAHQAVRSTAHAARQAWQTAERYAPHVDRAVNNVGIPVYKHVVRPLLQIHGHNTIAADSALKTYEGVRAALGR